MGNTDSKLSYRQRVLSLAQDVTIPLYHSTPISFGYQNFTQFWMDFLTVPENYTFQDLNQIVSTSDLCSIYRQNKTNYLDLVRFFTMSLIRLSHEMQERVFEDTDSFIAVKHQLLHCIRVLTRTLPLMMEDDEEEENKMFWNMNVNEVLNAQCSSAKVGDNGGALHHSDSAALLINYVRRPELNKVDETATKCLGHLVLEKLVQCLFIEGFTLELEQGRNLGNKSFQMWEHGIGKAGPYKDIQAEIDASRLEVLRLILVLCSRELYEPWDTVIVRGSKFLTVLVSSIPKVVCLTLLCSLVNVVCRAHGDGDDSRNGLTYGNSYSKQCNRVRKSFITLCTQLLVLLTVYVLPEKHLAFLTKLHILDSKPLNKFRGYLARIHKDDELKLMTSAMLRSFRLPMESALDNELNPFTLLRGSQQTSSQGKVGPWSTECVIFMWELFQCNGSFRSYVINRHGNELLVLLTYTLKHFRGHPRCKNSLIRVIAYFMVYLTSNPLLMKRSTESFTYNYYTNSLPTSYKLTSTNINGLSYRDFLLSQYCNIAQTMIDVTETQEKVDEVLLPLVFDILFNLYSVNPNDHGVDADQTSGSRQSTLMNYNACMSTMTLISKFQTHLTSHLNLDMLALLLRGVSSFIVNDYMDARTLLFLMSRHEKVLLSLQDAISRVDATFLDIELAQKLESQPESPNYTESPRMPPLSRSNSRVIQDDDAPTSTKIIETWDMEFDQIKESRELEAYLSPIVPVGLSKKAKEKASVKLSFEESWSGASALEMILEMTNSLLSKFPHISQAKSSDYNDLLLDLKYFENQFFSEVAIPIEITAMGGFKPLRFLWSNAALGWYTSILWGEIFVSNSYEGDTDTQNQPPQRNGLSRQNSASSNNGGWFKPVNTPPPQNTSTFWGFSWGSDNKDTPSSPVMSPQARLRRSWNFDGGMLSVSIWTGTQVSLIKVKKREVSDTIMDMTNNIIRRLRFNSTTSVNSMDSSNHGFQSPHPSANGNLAPIHSRQNSVASVRSFAGTML